MMGGCKSAVLGGVLDLYNTGEQASGRLRSGGGGEHSRLTDGVSGGMEVRREEAIRPVFLFIRFGTRLVRRAGESTVGLRAAYAGRL